MEGLRLNLFEPGGTGVGLPGGGTTSNVCSAALVCMCTRWREPGAEHASVGSLSASAASEFALSRRCKAAFARGSVMLHTRETHSVPTGWLSPGAAHGKLRRLEGGSTRQRWNTLRFNMKGDTEKNLSCSSLFGRLCKLRLCVLSFSFRICLP